MYYIMLDDVDWMVNYGPTHILDKNYNFLPIHIGKDISQSEEGGVCSLCISSDDYIMVDHNKPYVLIHEIDTEPSFDSLSMKIKEHIAEMYKIVIKDTKSLYREHTHIMSSDVVEEDV
jgi:hypothetical protein